MKQSTVIFGSLLAAFIIYITVRDQLPEYFSLFTSSADSLKTNSETTSGKKDANSENKEDPYGLNKIFKNLGIDEKGYI